MSSQKNRDLLRNKVVWTLNLENNNEPRSRSQNGPCHIPPSQLGEANNSEKEPVCPSAAVCIMISCLNTIVSRGAIIWGKAAGVCDLIWGFANVLIVFCGFFCSTSRQAWRNWTKHEIHTPDNSADSSLWVFNKHLTWYNKNNTWLL